jgi:hypothetical protein
MPSPPRPWPLLLLASCFLALSASPSPAFRPAGPPTEPRIAIGKYRVTKDRPSALVRRRAREKQWQLVPAGGKVYTGDHLRSLPGFASKLLFDRGVGLLLRGSVRAFSRHALQDFLLESAVVLHKNDKFDLDLTLQHGRIYLSNTKKKGAVKVRLRFEKEVWDLTLEPGAEVGIDLFKHFTADIDYRADEDPRAELYLCVLKGEIELRLNDTTHTMEAPPRGALFLWDNLTRPRGPISIKKVPEIWDKRPRINSRARRTTAALKDLAARLSSAKKSVRAVLQEGLRKKDPNYRLLCAYALGAVDDVEGLIDLMGDPNRANIAERDAAIFTLRRWIGRSATQGRLLYKPDKKSGTAGGLLLERKWSADEAHTLFDLLHDFKDEERGNPDTFEALAGLLASRRVALAEIAFWHLRRLAGGVKLPAFNAAAPLAERKKSAAAVRALIEAKKLPPKAERSEKKP